MACPYVLIGLKRVTGILKYSDTTGALLEELLSPLAYMLINCDKRKLIYQLGRSHRIEIYPLPFSPLPFHRFNVRGSMLP